jgi:myo-inositol 2-dehydrogenase / D-chiro-inositol 1-dehydrogenase
MAETKQAKIAMIGCGPHATNHLAPNVAFIPEIDLVAVCDLKEDLAKRNARNFGAKRWYTDAQRLLDFEPDLDGVIIVGWPQMMKELGELVLRQRRIPIFVEKPPAIDAGEAEAFAGTADEMGTWGQVAFMKRFSVGYSLAKQAVDEDWFGPVSIIDAKFANGDYGAIWGLPSPGLSYLTGQAVHIFDLIQYFAGPVAEINARYLERSPTTHGFAVTVGFAGGAIGTLNLNSFESWECFDEWFSVAGLYNYVTVEDMLYTHVWRRQSWAGDLAQNVANTSLAWKPTGPSVPPMEVLVGYRGELTEFARCILEGRRPGPDLHAGASAMRVGQAIWDSATTGQTVRLV